LSRLRAARRGVAWLFEGVSMKAVAWHGRRDIRVDDVPEPKIEETTDAVVQVTSAGICGSDLHVYEVLGHAFMEEGAILGHETIGIVEAVGCEVSHIKPGDRVVIPFNISCGHCFMCDRQLYSQCETTQVREHGKGATLFGYTKLYGSMPGGQAEFVRVPQAHFGPIKVPHGPIDDRFVYLSDVLPTAWQAVIYASVPRGGSLAVFGLGPIGQMCARVALHLRTEKVFGIDLVPERLELARRHGAEAIDLRDQDDIAAALRDRTDGRGPDAVIDAVGMEAHGASVAKLTHQIVGLLPSRMAEMVAEKASLDRLSALFASLDAVRRGGTVSIIGVYTGMIDPLPLMDIFDKQVQLRMGQANVKRWVDDLMPLLTGDDDPLGVDNFATHRLPLTQASHGYELFQQKREGAIKVLLKP
jgi:threonine dehydrogenase-like Zn-dependent dehydrogenase